MEKLKEKIRKEVELLAKHEEAVGFLYERFSYQFPKEKLWVGLMHDEAAHAKIIRGLFEELESGKIVASPNVFPAKELARSTAKLQKIAKNVKGFHLDGALKLAYKIEADIIESGYFKMFYPVSAEFKQVFSYLDKAANLHSKKVLKEIRLNQ